MRTPEQNRASVLKWQRTHKRERAERYANNPLQQAKARARATAHHYLAKYGLTLEQYERKLAEQNGVCAICQLPEPQQKRLAVDHNHATEEVRSLLCHRCNTTLGQVDENPALLLSMVAYLKRWNAQ